MRVRVLRLSEATPPHRARTGRGPHPLAGLRRVRAAENLKRAAGATAGGSEGQARGRTLAPARVHKRAREHCLTRDARTGPVTRDTRARSGSLGRGGAARGGA